MHRQLHRECHRGHTLIKRLFIPVAFLLLGALHAQGSVCTTVASGASTATIQSDLNSCGSGNTLAFASGGAWTITTPVTWACGVSMAGPTVAYPGPGPFSGSGPYLATITSNVTNNFAFLIPSSCSTPMSFKYFNYNGNQPSGGGGGAIYGPTTGGSNQTISNNYFHGNYASTTTAHQYDSLIWLDGVDTSGGNYWTNVTINSNSFGAATDCNPIMSLFTYQGGPYSVDGGYCTGISLHTSNSGLSVQNDAFYHLEQGMKFFQGGSSPNFFYTTNATVQFNDFSNIHRISIEMQHITSGDNFNFNSVHDQFYPGFGSFGFSFASYPGLNANSNVFAGNISAQCCGQGTTSYAPAALEFWGSGSASNNLFQNWTIHTTGGGCSGNCGAGILYGYSSGGGATFASDNFQFPNAWNYFVPEDSPPSPTITGTSTSTTISAITSASPSITPSSGVQTYPLTVTLTNAGYTSGAQPLGNTGIWYTIDGSTPVPGRRHREVSAESGRIFNSQPPGR